jgi:hypothetical protein
MSQKSFVDRDYNSVRHISVYYNNSRLLHRILRNTCQSFAEIEIIIFKFIILNDKYYNNVFRNIYSHKLQII